MYDVVALFLVLFFSFLFLPYLNYTATARCRLHRIAEGGLGVLAAAGKNDAAAPAACRSRRDAVGSSLVAQPFSIFIVLRHVSAKRGSFDTAHRGRPIESPNPPPPQTHAHETKLTRIIVMVRRWVNASGGFRSFFKSWSSFVAAPPLLLKNVVS